MLAKSVPTENTVTQTGHWKSEIRSEIKMLLTPALFCHKDTVYNNNNKNFIQSRKVSYKLTQKSRLFIGRLFYLVCLSIQFINIYIRL